MSDEEKTMVFKQGALAAPEAAAPEAGAKPPKAKLVCLDSTYLGPSQQNLVVELKGAQEMTLGRGRDNPIFIESMQVSRVHAALYPVDGGWGVRDLKSTNGVFVNGKQVSDARLAAGDAVKFGAIPFRFELERQEPAAGAPKGLERFKAVGEGDSEKTMMFGDVRASSKLLEAQDKEETEAQAEPQKKKGAPSAPAPSARPTKPLAKPAARPVVKPAAKSAAEDPDKTQAIDLRAQSGAGKSGIVKNAFFALIGLIIVAGGYFGYTMLRESNIVEAKRADVNRFVREAAAFDDPKRFGEERKSLAKLKEELVQAIADAPDKPELGPLLDRVVALEFERDFYEAMLAGNYGDARTAIANTRRKLAALQRASRSGTGNDAENMLATMEPAIPLREFAKAYPDHTKKSPAPTQQQIDAMLKHKEVLTKMHRVVNMDLVRHPFLARLLDQANQDIRTVERWDQALRVAK